MTRIHTISTRVDAAELKLFAEKAEEANLTQSEYLRKLAFQESGEPDALKLLAAEFRAVRSILFQLVTAALTRHPLTDEQIQKIVAFADATKYQRAEESLSSLAASLKGAPSHAVPTPDGTTDPR